MVNWTDPKEIAKDAGVYASTVVVIGSNALSCPARCLPESDICILRWVLPPQVRVEANCSSQFARGCHLRDFYYHRL